MQKKFLYSILILVIIVGVIVLYSFIFKKNTNNNLSSADFCTEPLSQCVGKKVRLDGEITKEVQESIGGPTGDFVNTEYLKLNDGESMVIHTKTPTNLPDKTQLEITGTVQEVRAGGRPGEKLEEETVEYQILVDEWKKI